MPSWRSVWQNPQSFPTTSVMRRRLRSGREREARRGRSRLTTAGSLTAAAALVHGAGTRRRRCTRLAPCRAPSPRCSRFSCRDCPDRRGCRCRSCRSCRCPARLRVVLAPRPQGRGAGLRRRRARGRRRRHLRHAERQEPHRDVARRGAAARRRGARRARGAGAERLTAPGVVVKTRGTSRAPMPSSPASFQQRIMRPSTQTARRAACCREAGDILDRSADGERFAAANHVVDGDDRQRHALRERRGRAVRLPEKAESMLPASDRGVDVAAALERRHSIGMPSACSCHFNCFATNSTFRNRLIADAQPCPASLRRAPPLTSRGWRAPAPPSLAGRLRSARHHRQRRGRASRQRDASGRKNLFMLISRCAKPCRATAP